MFGPFSHLQYRPCPECGASVSSEEMEAHTCDHERWLDYQMFQLRDEVADFDNQYLVWYVSPHGRFFVWMAENRL
jgi:hypothetical protein